jgi:PAS domain S-box-containing protein
MGKPNKVEEALRRELESLRHEVVELNRLRDEQVQTERILRESEEKYRYLAEEATDGIVIVQDALIRYVNARLAAMWGGTVDEIVGTPFDRYFDPDELPRLRKNYERRMRGEEFSSVYETILLRKDGERTYVEVNAGLITHEGRLADFAILRDITERKAKDTILRESEEKHRRLAEEATDGIAIIQDAVVRYANPRLAAMWGGTVEDTIGTPFTRYIAPEELPRVRDYYERRMRGEKVPAIYATILVRKDGSDVHVEMNAGTITHNGRPADLVIVRDITERSEREEALRESEAKYRELVEDVNAIILRMDACGNVTFFNPFAEKFFQYTKEEILGKNVVGTIVPCAETSGRDLSDMLLHAEREPEGYHENENENMRRSGERVWVAWKNKPLRDESGRLTGWLCIGTDSSVRKRAEEALRSRARELATLNALGERVSRSLELHQVAEAILEEATASVLPDLALLYVREGEELHLQGVHSRDPKFHPEGSCVKYLGECLCGLAASRTRPIYSADITRDPRCTLDLCKEIGLRSFAALPLQSSDGLLGVLGLGWAREKSLLEATTFLETFANQSAVGLQNALLYQTIRNYATQLEERVAERTAELTLAKERAEEADRVKSNFLAIVSHELRTPLTSIMGFTEILLKGLTGPLSSRQARHLSAIRDSAHHLLGLINDILDISTIEAGRIILTPAPFDVRKLIDRVIREVSPLAETKGLTLVAHVAPQVGRLTSDERRIEQVLINLLHNAVKSTEGGQVRLECEAKDDQLVIRVADTGIGIHPEDRDRLFAPFGQIGRDSAGRERGTGLGLSICKSLVEALGGEIRAKSPGPGQGSTFTFTLPMMKGQKEPSSSDGQKVRGSFFSPDAR